MANLLTKRSKSVGLAPGSIVFTGEKSSVPVRIRSISYSSESLIEREFDSINDVIQQHDPDKINWINSHRSKYGIKNPKENTKLSNTCYKDSPGWGQKWRNGYYIILGA